MHAVDITRTITHKGQTYLPGHKYVASDDIIEELRSIYGTAVGIGYAIELYHKQYAGEDLTDKKLFIYRKGGLGDLLFIEPSIRAIKEAFPTCQISVATQSKDVLLNHPAIHKIYGYPFDLQTMRDHEYHIHYVGLLELNSPDSKVTPAVELFAKASSSKLTDKIPKIYLSEIEISQSKTTIKNLGIKKDDYVVMIQLEASAAIRNIPANKLKECIEKLSSDLKIKILLVGTTDQQKNFAQLYKAAHTNVILCTQYTARQVIGLANECDILLGPDSFLIQVFGALGKPMVGVYNAFPSHLRMSQFKNAVGLDTMVACSPCFSYNQSCIKGSPPPCFTQLGADDILGALDYLRFKTTGVHFNFFETLKPNPRAINATH